MSETIQWIKRLNQEKVDNLYLKAFGKEYTDYRELWNKAGRDFLPDFPIHLDFEVTDACNLRCRHCYRDKEIAEKMGIIINTQASFSLQLFRKVVAEGVNGGLKAINLGFSGEPLINRDLIEMIHISHQLGVLDIRLLTNGSLLNKELADNLLESPLTFLSFSIDAGTAETYKSLKGKDCFDHLRNIVKYTYLRRAELKRVFPLIRASFYPCPESNGEQNMFLENFQSYVDFIDFRIFQDMRKARKHKIRIDCPEPFRRLSLFANGDVSCCCTFFSKKLIVGNINQMSLKEIWNSRGIKQIREGLMREDPVSLCRECFETISDPKIVLPYGAGTEDRNG